ncbi:MAG TPA: right-handed parallel beta-helix repeat-containing protein, partial [Phycisphaerae bacterium]|nr:right-handed parallel beta-helix repeat-containing protein [Phycisphaerae bacterium]
MPGNHNGLSWNGAFASLQSVLPLATTGDTVLVADGTYKPTSTTDRTARFALRGGATFLGGYAGYGAPNPSARDTTLYPTILSGEIGSAGTTADNSYHVLLLGSGTGIVDGFTISGGHANGTANHYDLGGAIGMPEQDMLWMLNIVSFQISNCIFRDNFAITGGAVGNSQSCTFTNCLFINNSATSGGALGGGSGRFINCTFFDNSAVNGGAISVYNSSPFFLNGRFVGNSATAGGVVYVQPSTGNITPTFTNCDLVANSSGIGTGGVLYNNATSSTPAFSNCIAWDNGGTPFVRSNGNLFVAQITCCDIQGGSLIGSGNINADPQFVRTPTSTDLGDMHLLSTSPCIDVGNVSATGLTGTATLTDFDGQPRFTDIPSV